ncbi:NOGCT domain protein [Trichuris suis]|nr:NOGCT domain protein [Trichuris suis]
MNSCLLLRALRRSFIFRRAKMVHYNFKGITVVPTSKQLKEIFLSKTQRKTPTVIHRHYAISRIRQFYSRKVKFMQQSIHDRLSLMLDEFPKLDEIHPFYADLMNILYDRDHYKIALGQISIARNLVDNVSKEYTRLMKYGDSLYRCKMLKRAALGRMCKILTRQKDSLLYLEQVRQHLSRLPSIDPNTRTLIICGFPNVGKSSLINKLTRADVEVQPYAFTTKSLYVGHMDYKYLRWQVIDTPGILDQPLEERNTIEMQAITALAHIRAAVLYIMDVSEQCNYGIEEQAIRTFISIALSVKFQIALFESIQPLFANKPVLVGLNKCDIRKVEELPPEKQVTIQFLFAISICCLQKLLEVFASGGVPVFSISTVTLEGIMNMRNEACDLLLESRIEEKLNSKTGSSLANRLHVAIPAKVEGLERPPFIPDAVLQKRSAMVIDEQKEKKLLERDIELQLGDDYTLDLKKNYLLCDEEKYDKIPEIWEGHNIADFMDPANLDKLKALEEEERLHEKAGFYDSDMEVDDEETADLLKQAALIRKRQMLIMKESRERRMSSRPRLPRQGRVVERNVNRLRKELADRGLEIGRKRLRHLTESEVSRPSSQKRVRFETSTDRSRSSSKVPPRDEQGVNEKVKKKVVSMGRKAQKSLQRKARIGESDRRIPCKRPKHLFAGKRGIGKNQRR